MIKEERIPTGIAGLDRIIEGGLRNNTTTLVVGSSGTGKSTFAMQYIMHGLENGENALYISLEEPPEQIIREAGLLGFDMAKYYEKELFFFHSKGEDFRQLIETQLPALVEAKSEFQIRTRVVIDPLTPLIWSVQDKQEQRDLVTKLFYVLKQLGPVLVTTEEHAAPGQTVGEDVLIPIYMSDGAIHLNYRPIGGAFNRSLEIIKMRATRHGEEVYPYIFVRGLGVVVRTPPMVSAEEARKFDDVFDKAIRTAEDLGASELLLNKLVTIKENWPYPYSPKETLQIVFESQGLTGEGAIKKVEAAPETGAEDISEPSVEAGSESEAESAEVLIEDVPIIDDAVDAESGEGGDEELLDLEDIVFEDEFID